MSAPSPDRSRGDAPTPNGAREPRGRFLRVPGARRERVALGPPGDSEAGSPRRVEGRHRRAARPDSRAPVQNRTPVRAQRRPHGSAGVERRVRAAAGSRGPRPARPVPRRRDGPGPGLAATPLHEPVDRPAGLDGLPPSGLRRPAPPDARPARRHLPDPWCDAPIRHADHGTPHRTGGATSYANGSGLCERCNQTKEAGSWRYRASPEHLDVVTPTGHAYRASTTPMPPVEAGSRVPRRTTRLTTTTTRRSSA